MGIKDRLQEIADALGSRVALAKAAGVSKGRITQWLDGDVKGLMAESALNIEKNTAYSVRWLVYGTGPKRTNGKNIEDEVARHMLQSGAIPAREWNKFVVITKAFLDTDDEGRTELAAAAVSVVNGKQLTHRRANRR